MAAATSVAHASSFVVIGTPKSTPSVVSLSASPPAQSTASAEQKTNALVELMQADLRIHIVGEPEQDQPPSRKAAAPGHRVISSPSIIALGEPAPDVAYEQVAAIPAPVKHSAHAAPLLVIRGGIVGDAFSAPSAPTAAVQAPPITKAEQSASATPPSAAQPGPAPGQPPAPAAKPLPPTAVRE